MDDYICIRNNNIRVISVITNVSSEEDLQLKDFDLFLIQSF